MDRPSPVAAADAALFRWPSPPGGGWRLRIGVKVGRFMSAVSVFSGATIRPASASSRASASPTFPERRTLRNPTQRALPARLSARPELRAHLPHRHLRNSTMDEQELKRERRRAAGVGTVGYERAPLLHFAASTIRWLLSFIMSRAATSTRKIGPGMSQLPPHLERPAKGSSAGRSGPPSDAERIGHFLSGFGRPVRTVGEAASRIRRESSSRGAIATPEWGGRLSREQMSPSQVIPAYQPDRLPIALRAFAPQPPKPGAEPSRKSGPGKPAPASEWTLVFDTETSVDAAQRLRVGHISFADMINWTKPGSSMIRPSLATKN